MSQGYTNIPDWMLAFDLDVYETIILAVIYGFSQDDESTFKGSWKYLAKKAKCSRAKVARTLPKLVEMGLVVKDEKEMNGIKFCEYRVSPIDTGSISQIRGGGIPERPNNIDIENIDNTLSNKGRTSRFVKPSIEEIEQYCIERNNGIDAENFYNFYESKGWVVGKAPMKDWKAAVRTWERRPSAKSQPARQRESVYEHNMKVMSNLLGK